jgi:hypothetical protein
VIAVVINFCTNDVRFLDRCIEEAKKISSEIIIPVCDHFFDGTVENLKLLEKVYSKYTDCTFIEYAYSHERLYSRFIDLSPNDLDWKMYWFVTSRYIGYLYASQEAESILFLDTDEIIDGERFSEWLSSFQYRDYDALRFLSYYYFREARFQAKNWVNNALLVKKSALNHTTLFNDWDRKGIFSRVAGRKCQSLVGLDGKPLVHHYSWVKTKKECLKKADTYGHFWEMDFAAAVEKEFSREFQGTDFAFQYEYGTVEPFFDPLAAEPLLPEASKVFPHVKKTDRNGAFEKELSLEFNF